MLAHAGTSFYRRLNPLLMPDELAETTGARQAHVQSVPALHVAVLSSWVFQGVFKFLFRGLRPEAGNAGSRGDLSHFLSFVAHTCARLSPLQKLDLLKKREREREMCI